MLSHCAVLALSRALATHEIRIFDAARAARISTEVYCREEDKAAEASESTAHRVPSRFQVIACISPMFGKCSA
jgi:hypothetical protein